MLTARWRTRRPRTPGARARRPELGRLRYGAKRRVWGSGPLPLPSQRCALLSLRLQEGGGAGGDGCRSPLSSGRLRAPGHPRPQPRGAWPRRRARAHARTHTRTHTSTLGPPPQPSPWAGIRPPARRHSRLRLPACVYNFVLLPRPPCSWKGGGGMWKAAARRLTGGSSGGLQRWPERLSFARVARPLLAWPRTCAGLCVLPPRP